INSFIGTLAVSYASSNVISSLNNGSSASLYTSLNVGAMMKNVKNKAKPTSTWFGGICCVANDIRTNDRTTTIRVKLVIKINMPGASDKMVNRMMMRTEFDIAEGSELENISINSFMFIILLFIRIE